MALQIMSSEERADVDLFCCNWESIRLGEVCLKTDFVNPMNHPEDVFTYIDVSSVSNESFRVTKTNQILGKDAPSRARKRILAGDVIFATVRPTLKRIALIPSELDGEVCSTGYCVVRADSKRLEPEFAYYFLLCNKVFHQVESLQKGATYPAISDVDIYNLPLLLPPLPEQRAIVHVLGTIHAAIQMRRCELELEHERKSALMQRLFTRGLFSTETRMTKFGNIPNNWNSLLVEECAYVQTGIAKGRKLEGMKTLFLPYLRVANVQDGFLDLTKIKNIELLENEVNRYMLQAGDVLMTEGGDFDKLGRGYIWKDEISKCVHQNHIFAVRVNCDILNPEFFAYLIQSEYGKAYFLSVAHRTTNLASINSTKLKKFPALVPNLDEQKKIVDIIKANDNLILSIEHEKDCLEELFDALLEELMLGRLSALPLIK